jgi:S-DNA-T family DNA segregation ATPase FtsK/SpoIIIE
MRRNTTHYTRAAIRAGDAPIVQSREQSLLYRERIFVPLWVTLLGQLLTGAARCVVRAGRSVLHHPARSGVLAGLLLIQRWAGWRGQVVLAVVVVLTGALWCYRWPESFDRQVIVRARTWWRYRRVYRPTWRDLMAGCGLVEATETGETLPQIDRLTSYPGRDHLTVVLAPGQIPDDVTASCEALAHGLRAWRVTARTVSPGLMALDVLWADPLADALTPDPGSTPGDTDGPGRWLTPQTVLHRLAAVVVGRTESGGPWTLSLVPGRHLLVSGSTGSGKSGLLWAIVWDLAGLIRAGWVSVTAFDPKYVELRALAILGLGTVHTDVPSMPGHFEALVAEMDARCAAMTTRLHLPSVAEPVRLIVVDELATLTALADTKSRRRVEDALGHLLSRGRAAGFELILTSVEATKDVVRWRGLCATRVCYRTDDDGAADLVLGDGARDRGAATELISEDTPGVAYTRTEGRRDIARVRTLHVTDDHLAALAETDPSPAEPSHANPSATHRSAS